MKSFAVALLALVNAAAAQEAKEDSEACKTALEVFRTAYRNADEGGRASAAAGLGKHICPKAIGLLAPLLTQETDAVRIAAAKALGGMDHPKAVEVLAQAVTPNLKRHEVLDALAKALGDLEYEAGATILNPLLAKHHDNDVLEALHVIIPALGKIGSPSSVEPLANLLEDVENESKRVRTGKFRAAGNPKMGALKDPTTKALREITGGDAGSGDNWQDWWMANRERLLAGATLVYRCRETGKRWAQPATEAQNCPHHDKSGKDGQIVKSSLRKAKS